MSIQASQLMVNVGANTAQATADLTGFTVNVGRNFASMSDAVTAATARMDAAMAASGLSADAWSTRIRASQTTLKDGSTLWSASASAMANDTERTASAFEGMAGRVSKAIGSMFSGLGNVGQLLGNLAGTVESVMGRVLKALSIPAVVAGGALGAISAYSVKAAGDFQSMTQLFVTQSGEQASSLDMVRQGILKMSSEYGVAATDIAAGGRQVEDVGYHGAAALDVLAAAAMGSKVGLADFGTVANALTSVMVAYGRSGNEAAATMGQINAAVGAGKVSMEQFSAAIGNALPVASELHIPFEQLAAMADITTRLGLDASSAFTNMRFGLMNLATDATPKAQAALKELGLTGQQVSNMFFQNGPVSAIEMLKQKMDDLGISAREESVIFQDVFGGVRGLQGVLATAQNLDQVKTIMAAIGDETTATKNIFADWQTVQGNFNTQWDRFTASIQRVGIELGDLLLPKITPIVQAFADQLPTAFETVIPGLEALGSAFVTTMQGIVETVQTAVMVVYELFSYLNPFIPHSPALVPQVQDGMQLIKDAFGSLVDVAPVLESFGGSLDTLKNNITDVVNSATSALDDLKGQISDLQDQLQTVQAGPQAYQDQLSAAKKEQLQAQVALDNAKIGSSTSSLNADLASSEHTLAEMEKNSKGNAAAIKDMKGHIADVRYELAQTKAPIQDLQKAYQDASNKVQAIQDQYKLDTFDQTKALQDQIKTKQDQAKKDQEALAKTQLALKEVDAQVSAIAKKSGGTGGAFGGMGGPTSDAIVAGQKKLIDALNAANNGWDAKGAPKTVQQQADLMWQQFTGYATSDTAMANANTPSPFEKLNQQILDFSKNLQDAAQKAQAFMKQIQDAMTVNPNVDPGVIAHNGGGGSIMDRLGQVLGPPTQALGEKLGEGIMTGIGTGISNGLANFGTGFLGAFRPGGEFSTILFGAVSALSGGANSLLQRLFYNDGSDAGGQLVDGFYSGIGEGTGKLFSSLGTWANGVVTSVKTFFGIASPSTVFAEIGRNIVEGLWNGILSLAKTVNQGMLNWAQANIVDATKAALGIGGSNSPSTVFEAVGNDIVEGIVKGINGAADSLLNTIKKLVNDAIGLVNKFIEAWDNIKIPTVTISTPFGGQTFGGGSFPQITPIKPLAEGTDNFPGGWALFGENGPEIGKLPAGTQMLSNSRSRNLLDSQPIVLNLEISAFGSPAQVQKVSRVINTGQNRLVTVKV